MAFNGTVGDCLLVTSRLQCSVGSHSSSSLTRAGSSHMILRAQSVPSRTAEFDRRRQEQTEGNLITTKLQQVATRVAKQSTPSGSSLWFGRIALVQRSDWQPQRIRSRRAMSCHLRANWRRSLREGGPRQCQVACSSSIDREDRSVIFARYRGGRFRWQGCPQIACSMICGGAPARISWTLESHRLSR